MSEPITVMVDEFKVWTPRQARSRVFGKGSSHLTVNGSTPEHLAALHELAGRIGMKRSWFQPHKSHPHYDLVESKRDAALEAGAVFVGSMDQARARLARRRDCA